MIDNQRKNKRLKLLHDSGRLKEHFKMYKVGRTWLFSGVTVLVFGAATFFDLPSIKADTTAASTVATEQVNGSSASTAKALSSAANFSLATSNASASSSIASAGNSSATNTNSVASKNVAVSQSNSSSMAVSQNSPVSSAANLNNSGDKTNSSAVSEVSSSSTNQTGASVAQTNSESTVTSHDTGGSMSSTESLSSNKSISSTEIENLQDQLPTGTLVTENNGILHIDLSAGDDPTAVKAILENMDIEFPVTLSAKDADTAISYSAANLINSGEIILNSLNWSSADNSTMDYYQFSVPTDGLITIKANSGLKAGDTINLGNLSITGQLTGSASMNLSSATLTGIGTLSGSVITLDDTYNDAVDHSISIKFPTNISSNTTKNIDDSSLKISETYLGQTITINYEPVIPAAVVDNGGGFTENSYTNGTTGYVYSGVQFGSTTPYKDLLGSDGTITTDTSYPDQDLVYVWRFAANPNLQSVSSPQIYENGGTTGMQGIMPDASDIANNGHYTNGSFDGLKFYTIPSDTAIADVENVLPVGGYTTYQDADGNWYAAVNFGQFGTDNAVKTTADWVTDSVNDNPWTADEGADEKAVTALTGNNAINGSFISAGIQVNGIPIDPNYVTPFEITVYSSSNSFATPISNLTAETKPTSVAVAGQNTVQFVNVDQDGNLIGATTDSDGNSVPASTTLAGWADGNSVGQTATNYDYTAAKNLTDSNGEAYRLDDESQAEYTGPYSLTNKVIYVVYDATVNVTLTYVDDDNKEEPVGDSVTQSGFAGDSVTFDNITVPANYELASGETAADKTVTLMADDSDNIVIHLVHKTVVTTPTDPDDVNYGDTHQSVNEIINYVYADGTQAHDPATASLDFTRTVTTDSVTGEVTSYGDWTAVDGDDFAAVESPVIVGYTPDVSSVAAVNDVDAAADDLTEKVTYSVDNQKANIKYVDETTGDTLKTDPINGDSNTTSDYSTADEIAALEGQGYELVSDTVPAGGIVFDTDGKTDQSYTVTFKHKTGTTTPTDPDDVNYDNTHQSVNETINYVYADGIQAHDPATASLDFTRTVTTDSVTGEVTSYGDWTAVDGDDFAAVESPVIVGYTPDVSSVAAVNDVDAAADDLTEKVTYSVDNQKANIKYVDETTGDTLKTDPINGDSNTTSDYSTADEIAALEGQGYELVSDTVPAGGIVFDTDGKTDQSYTVTFKHKTVTTTPTDPDDVNYDNTHQSVNETINYVYADGTRAHDPATASLDFTRTVTTDSVTGEVTSYGDWTAVDGDDFAAVESPVIVGYTPSQATYKAVNNVTADHGNIVGTITYSKTAIENEDLTIKYIDDTDDSTVKTDTISGEIGASGSYKVNIPAGYTLADGQNSSMDYTITANDSDNLTVHLTHKILTVDPSNPGTDPVDPDNPDGPTNADYTDEMNQTVNETIHYVYADGSKAAEDHTDSVSFNRTVTIDEVTGQVVSYGDWKAVNGDNTFDAVTSPTIAGYTVSQAVYAAQTVSGDSNNIEAKVTYTAKAPAGNSGDNGGDKTPEQPSTELPGATGETSNTVEQTGAKTQSKQEPVKTNNLVLHKESQAKKAAVSEVKRAGILPQTGDNKNSSLSVLGVALLSATLSLFGLRLKKKEDN
ncbi:KxYKxGKxW signal peptide domain-containing protein [Pediococcus inopinatus]|uniref:KxYKxGKxW signal peptide domain-containing protein n=1 Tax=Pediococcus inopinatus TaxID=114090 RepID=A0ABZ0Q7D9_9LACO|nr:KxYKxGKxW signal peptide domain-containing protein [Pediococcus inopinatus]WPC20346.1 KxYKxGKxW signal peptide domain-containing protein [Pediococcus inopinatus]WPC22050.1 KxYKxGKxW signal peptide domain-containing protein [Pediococcus inopinatus]WPP09018.1 KxYKxGKxW signal peptide domain-containing protein [Pediococcus inopinatus]